MSDDKWNVRVFIEYVVSKPHRKNTIFRDYDSDSEIRQRHRNGCIIKEIQQVEKLSFYENAYIMIDTTQINEDEYAQYFRLQALYDFKEHCYRQMKALTKNKTLLHLIVHFDIDKNLLSDKDFDFPEMLLDFNLELQNRLLPNRITKRLESNN